MTTIPSSGIRALVAALRSSLSIRPVTASHFCRSLLPAAYGYYRMYFGDGMRVTGKGWLVRCPFHNDRHPSASIYRDGGFHCHACGVHCRDVLDFHQRVTGLSFKQAAQALGAWRDAR